MTPTATLETWAPPDAAWSAWVKPVLFAHLGIPLPLPPSVETNLPGIPIADGSTALVFDLPGPAAALAAPALARLGYRPILLYNAIPGPPTYASLCDVATICAVIAHVTPQLAAISLAPDAPPAFLLDADRATGTGVGPAPGMFDNRSVSLPTDFPSANLLLSRGITRILLVQPTSQTPQPDLAHTLLRYQQAGIAIHAATANDPGPPRPVLVTRPRLYRRLVQRFAATLGLRRNPLGGFGGHLPIPSSSG